MNLALYNHLEDLENEFSFIPKERKDVLKKVAKFITKSLADDGIANVNFICTHNSRRSHLAQIWAQTAAAYFGLAGVNAYSGGTEATAVFPSIIDTLKKTGFEIDTLAKGKNPIYTIKFDENEAAIIGFSKTYDHSFNPKSDYCAVLVCAGADENCPVVNGADERILITYDDPKEFDGKSDEAEKYEERSVQIAREMLYLMHKVK